jgi:hypothetical protein
MTSIVMIVTMPNVKATITTPPVLCLAAGYMINGISGSQGPNTNMAKRIQGVIFVPFPWS